MDGSDFLSIVIIVVVALANFAVQRAARKKNQQRTASGGTTGSANRSGSANRAKPVDQMRSAEQVRDANQTMSANRSGSVNQAKSVDQIRSTEPRDRTAPAAPADAVWAANPARQPLSREEFDIMTGSAVRGAPIFDVKPAASRAAQSRGAPAAHEEAISYGTPAAHGEPHDREHHTDLTDYKPPESGMLSARLGSEADAAAVERDSRAAAERPPETEAGAAGKRSGSESWFGGMSGQNLACAVVWSEILGAPRAVKPFGRQ
jgi:hypothetical protein